jgi:hypothetical protein
LLWARERLKDGIPAAGGGVYDQPSSYVEDMIYLDNLEYFYGLDDQIAEAKKQIQELAKKRHSKLT